MATISETVKSAAAFRDQLNALADEGSYSEQERHGFFLLHLFYSDRLAGFQNAPSFGSLSPAYDNPKQWADEGSRVVAGAAPGDAPSQQPIYDAANNGGDALDAVTAKAAPKGFLNAVAQSASSVRGSLLVKGTVHA
ncbi:hypothetical protein KZ813_06995 [Sphingomonas sp. RHCKR7]|uniref:hypothetical protein n=1 Tax=Sphingomonas folli TaxID=2862497 RepID=UPI001CA525B3|nr:hypothetical protein [Sphingomonas folli]MBW6526582.1 hypothetical protein [Sphingomonas folli]